MPAFTLNMLPFLQWLLKASLQGSLLIGFIFLIKSLLRDRLPVRWYSYLWLLLLLRLALPWVPSSRVSVFNLVPDRSWPGHKEVASSSVDTTPESMSSQRPVTHGPTRLDQAQTST